MMDDCMSLVLCLDWGHFWHGDDGSVRLPSGVCSIQTVLNISALSSAAALCANGYMFLSLLVMVAVPEDVLGLGTTIREDSQLHLANLGSSMIP